MSASLPLVLAGAATAGAVGAQVALRTLRQRPPGGLARWARSNARGREVSLLAGPAWVTGAAVGILLTPRLEPRTRRTALGAVLAAGAFGGYDDLAGSGAERGLRGHLHALTEGRLTTGAVKMLGLAGVGVLAGAALRPAPVDAALAAAVVAGSANLANLLDLRPGRALKAALLCGVPGLLTPAGLLLAAPLGAALGVLPDDLHERVMLGDAGANALGAALGVAVAAHGRRPDLVLAVGMLVALTLASERVSFSAVIDRTPVLRELDALGRLP